MRRWFAAYALVAALIALVLVQSTTHPGLQAYSAGLFVGAMIAAPFFAVAFLGALCWHLVRNRRRAR